MAAITDQEKLLISKLRDNIKDLNLSANQNDERILIRWIRGRDQNLARAEEMLRNSLKWRKANDIDNIQYWKAPETLYSELPMLISGQDREGCPVCYLRLGAWDVKRLVATGQRETCIKFTDHIFDTILGTPRPNGNTQMFLVVDMEHYSFRQLTAYGTVDALLEIVRRFDLNYPETLKSGIIINASKVVTILYSMVKQIIAARTISKIEVFSTNASKWKARLQQSIPLEELPVNYGGTNVWAQNILNGNKKTEAEQNRKASKDGLMMVEINVNAGTEAKVEFDVEEPNSILRWAFRTNQYDIGFSVHHNSREVVAYKQYDSKTDDEMGFLLCETVGKYTLCFNNKYSRIRNKSIHYVANITPPPPPQEG